MLTIDLVILIFSSLCGITILSFAVYFFVKARRSTELPRTQVPDTAPEPELPEEPEEIGILDGCGGKFESDKLADISGNQFSCCKAAQICDETWWTQYAPSISDGDQQGKTTLNAIVSLAKKEGVIDEDADFGDLSVRKTIHKVISEQTCPEVCSSLKTDAISYAFSSEDQAEPLISIIGEDTQPDLRDTTLGKCVDHCAEDSSCDNVIFAKVAATKEEGDCVKISNEQAEAILANSDLSSFKSDMPIAQYGTGKAAVTLIRRSNK